MAGMPAKRRATYEDLLALPERVVGEIIDGELHVSPRPGTAHARAASELGVELGAPFGKGKGGPGGWIILDEPEVHLSEQIVVPDLAGWRRERMPELPHSASIDLSPDWVCEILSASTESFDRARKLPVYAQAGVKHAWLVNPLLKTLEILRLDGRSWLLVGTLTDDRVRAEPFDAVEIQLSALWAR